ncbi:MAG: phosphate-selective porin [Fibrobacteria bacterium]|jgi:hypothetical protein|nr:phosphate-selective porin [Fibrobacteria bacterium]
MKQHVSRIFSGALAMSLLTGVAFGQNDSAVSAEEFETLKGQVESLNEGFLVTKTTVDKLAKIKVSGYVQAQYQIADSNGIASMAGGNFPANANQRFLIRRARLKTVYDNITSQLVIEVEARPSGVSLKDAEVILNEPWLKTFSLAAGYMDRPFGFEIGYSSSAHEAPERARVYQAVFKDEKDLGLKFEANPTDRMGFLQYLNYKGGIYTGTSGYNGGTGDEIDSTVDLIGRVGFKLPFYDLGLAVDGGASYYLGSVLSLNDTSWVMRGDTALLASTGNQKKRLERNAFGVDAQVYYTIPVIGDRLGGTSLRGEYLWGQTPGTLASNGPYGASVAGTQTAVRNFSGWYASWIQNYGDKLQSVVKYDVFDPNTDVTGARVGVATGGRLSKEDLKYTTLGLGLIYYWDEAVRITMYWDFVTNEKAGGTANGVNAAFGKDLKDNVATLRAQVKF